MDNSLPNLPNVRNVPKNDDQGVKVVPPTIGGMTAKEFEKIQIAKTEGWLEEAGKLPELEPELEKAGVQKVQGEVQIPAPVSQMGARQAGPTAPVAGLVAVALPITDDQVFAGLHKNVFDAFRWLAEWSVRRLKMANIMLRKVGGKIIRIPTK